MATLSTSVFLGQSTVGIKVLLGGVVTILRATRSRYSSGSIVSDYGLDDRGFDPRQGQKISPLSSVSRPALGPTQPPVQRIPGVLSSGAKRGRGVTLTTHPHLVLRSRMSRSYTYSPPSASMACSGTVLLYCGLLMHGNVRWRAHSRLLHRCEERLLDIRLLMQVGKQKCPQLYH
jgi:hypothetical protein